MSVVVCKLVQYPILNGKIAKDLGQVQREEVVIPRYMFDAYNKEHETTKYVEDEKATKAYMKKFEEKAKDDSKQEDLNV